MICVKCKHFSKNYGLCDVNVLTTEVSLRCLLLIIIQQLWVMNDEEDDPSDYWKK